MKNNKVINMIATVLAAVSFFAAAVSSGSGSGETASKVSEVSSSSKSGSAAESVTKASDETETQAAAYNVGDVIETNDLRISYLSCGEYNSDNQFIAPKEGNKFIYCEFEFENISDSDKLITSWDFDCFADNNSCEDCYSGDDVLDATLSAGRKTKGKVYFEVPVNAETIEIEYEFNWISSKKIIFLYK